MDKPEGYALCGKYELPYEGAKEILFVDEIENKDFLAELLNAMCHE